MPEGVRIGIVGTGWWAEAMHLPSFGSHPRARITAICGRNAGRAAELARRAGGARVFADYGELVASDVDAVVVATPDDLHHPVTMAALDAGRHVLCEKPMANSLADARAMLAKAEAAGVRHMMMFSWRWQPHWLYIKRLLDEGFVGRCHYASIAFVSDGALHPSYQWRMDGRRATGALGDLGSHMFDFTRWLLGEVQGVGARLTRAIDRSAWGGEPTADTAAVSLALEGGTLAQIHLGMAAAYGDAIVRLRAEFQGDEGTLEAQHDFFGSAAGVRTRGCRRGEPFRDLATPAELLAGSDPADPLSPYRLHSAGPRHFVDAILAGEPPSPSFLDGMKAQEVIDAAARSSAEGRWIELG
jgi:predicted dehydrogenase